MSDWQPTACILCECNCGIEVQLGGDDGRHFARIRGDKEHPASQGYVCQKATRLDHYQNGRDRLTAPLRRRDDGSFEEIDWDTAIREVAERLAAVRDSHGGDKIFYYGGAGQGNHLPAAYAGATLHALGAVFRSNALAQEKTGEFWVNAKMFGAGTRGDFENCQVAVFLGKNPWHSHGIPRARVVLREIARDPARTMIVIDPRRSETADLADTHLQLKPGSDAWLLAAILGVLVQEERVATAWVTEHTVGLEQILPLLHAVPIADYSARAGIEEDIVRRVARTLAEAESVAIYEDLGVQMNRNSTLVSYLHRLLVLLTGNFANPGGQYIATTLHPLAMVAPKPPKQTPVTKSKVIAGLVPCNVIAEEILCDHPDRFRAMIVESSNPAHSLADTRAMREALESLDTLVVIDVAMTETAQLADYVLPVPTQYEKWEATFFNFDFPHNCFHLRRPLLPPPADLLTEPEIHARLVESLGAMPEQIVSQLEQAHAAGGRLGLGAAFLEVSAGAPDLRWLASVVLYRALGPKLPDGSSAAAALWGAAHQCAQRFPDSVRRAGFDGKGPMLGEQLFDALLESASGFVFSMDEPVDSWSRVRTHGGRIQLALPELFGQLEGLATQAPPAATEAFPFILSAGERRAYTANTIYRDPAWRRRGTDASLRINPADAERLGVVDGDLVRLSTKRAAVEVPVEASDRMQPGHVSLPNGTGLDNQNPDGRLERSGIAPNDLTAAEDRDFLAGTPWHKSVPARIETVA